MARKKLSKNMEVEAIGPELDKLLKALPEQMKKETFNDALVKSSNIVVRAARALAPIGKQGAGKSDDGVDTLRDSIGYVVRKYQGGLAQLGVMGPSGPTWYGHLLEFGHKVLSRGPNRKRQPPLQGKDWVRARKFMKPAVDRTKRHVNDTIVKSVQAGIAKSEKRSNA